MPTETRNIQIDNASFEDRIPGASPVPEAENFDFLRPPGWDDYDPNNLVPEEGNGTLGTAFYSTWRAPELFFDDIPDGDQITSIFLNADANGQSLEGRGEVGISQTTEEIVQPNTTYTLSADILDTKDPIGKFPFFNGITGARLDIVAGDEVVASKEFLNYGEGEVFHGQVSFNSSDYPNVRGETLGVRLVNLNLDNGVEGGNGFEVNFDDVQFTASNTYGNNDDTINGGQQRDNLFGLNGQDILNGNGGNDTLSGGDGDDKINGGFGNDLLLGEDNNDVLTGGFGNDTLIGSKGNDRLIGNAGRDVFVLGRGEDTDFIADFTPGEDLIDLTGNLSFGNNVFQENNQLVSYEGNKEILANLEGFDSTLDATDFI